MSIDDQLKQIKTHTGKSLYDVQLRRARVTALVLATSTIVTLIFLVFAFVQKAAADVARSEALKYEQRTRQLEAQLINCQTQNQSQEQP